MSHHVRSYAAHSPTGRLGLFTFDRRSPRPDDVVIEILYCGVCHSDVHNVRNDWGNARYPMVPGHEIIGRVVEVGPEVKRFKPGDRVGVGCLVESCRHCGACGKGWEQYCENDATYTYNHDDPIDGTRTYGGYSEKIVVAGRCDLIIDTVPYSHDVNPYVPTLASGGTIVMVGYLGPLEPGLNSGPLVFGRKALAGSLIGGIAETQEMLDFCGEHGIHSDIEIIRIQEINEAYERVLSAQVKYRFVIDMASLKAHAAA